MKRVLIITSSPLHNGPRLVREIDALKDNFLITAVGATRPHLKSIEYISYNNLELSLTDRIIKKFIETVTKRPYLSLLPNMQRRFNKLIDSVKPDVLIIHSPSLLPYAVKHKTTKVKLVYNAHEYHPLEFENEEWERWSGKRYRHIYETCLLKCDLVINVCDGIAEKCQQEFDVKSLVIPNAAGYYQMDSLQDLSWENPLRFIHHGGTNADRKIERMIEAFQILGPNYHLDLMLVENQPEYYTYLNELAAKTENVQLIKPVKFEEIIPFLSTYHAGVYLLPPSSFNNKHALPNKFFEFIQARLPIISGPSVEMQSIIQKFDLGIISADFTPQTFADAIKSLNADNAKLFKQNAHKAAKELSGEHFQHILRNEIEKLLKF